MANFLSISPNQNKFLSYVSLVPVGLFCHSCFNLCSFFNKQANLAKWKQQKEKIAKNSKCTRREKTSEKRDLWLLLSLFLLFLGKSFQQLRILNGIGRNFLLGNRKKIAKCLTRAFNCRSTFLYACQVGIRRTKKEATRMIWYNWGRRGGGGGQIRQQQKCKGLV